MCTLALFFRALHAYPLVVAANRDEQRARPSAPPLVLRASPRVIGGKDLIAGGTWLGINEHGLLVGTLNRRPPEGKEAAMNVRSRGLLCLDLLESKTAAQAIACLREHKISNYQSFNLLIADANEAQVAYNESDNIHFIRLEPGLHVISNSAIYYPPSEKMDRAYGLFARIFDDIRTQSDAATWIPLLQNVLSNHDLADSAGESRNAICVHADSYGTVSSSIVYLSRLEQKFRTFFASGPPCQTRFEETLDLEILP